MPGDWYDDVISPALGLPNREQVGPTTIGCRSFLDLPTLPLPPARLVIYARHLDANRMIRSQVVGASGQASDMELNTDVLTSFSL